MKSGPEVLQYGSVPVRGVLARLAMTWWFPYLTLLLLAIAVYAPTLSHQFVWDDLEQVRDNEYIRHWDSFPEFWRKDILQLSRKGGVYHSNYYRPLFYVQYLLYYQMFGLNTTAWHALAILHHFLASAAVYLFLRRIGFGLGVAWPAALLFVVHPAHGESVSWVAASFNDPPAATFLLLGLTAHATWVLRRRSSALVGAVLAYAGGLCLKESALSMLLLAPLVQWYLTPPESGPRRWGDFALGLAPYVGLTAIYFVVRKVTLGYAFGYYGVSKSWAELGPTLPMLAAFYVRLLLWPFGMSPSYGLRYVPGWGDVQAWGSVAGVAALVVFVWVITRRHRAMRFAAFWTALCIWPVFNIRSFKPEYLAHQRYLYLASLAVCLAVAWLLEKYVARRQVRWGALAAVLAVWAGSNVVYNPAWKSDHNLWTRITEVDPKNCAGFDWLGNEALDNKDIVAAEAFYDRSIAAKPDSPYAYQNKALIRVRHQNRPTEAIPLYEKALELHTKEGSPDPLAVRRVQINYGAALAQVGRRDEALRVFLQTVAAPPISPDGACNAALLLTEGGQAARAEQVLLAARTAAPEEKAIWACLAKYYQRVGRAEEAARVAQEYTRRFGGR